MSNFKGVILEIMFSKRVPEIGNGWTNLFEIWKA